MLGAWPRHGGSLHSRAATGVAAAALVIAGAGLGSGSAVWLQAGAKDFSAGRAAGGFDCGGPVLSAWRHRSPQCSTLIGRVSGELRPMARAAFSSPRANRGV